MLELCGSGARVVTLPVILRLPTRTSAERWSGRYDTELTVVPGADGADQTRRESTSLIDGIVRDGARRTLAQALQTEVEDYIARFAADRDESGRPVVVRNGSHQPRQGP